MWPQVPPLAARAVGGDAGGSATSVLASTSPSAADRREQRLRPGEVPARPCVALRHVEVAAEDDPGAVGRVEQRQRGPRRPGASTRAPSRRARRRRDTSVIGWMPGHGQPRDGDRARVRRGRAGSAAATTGCAPSGSARSRSPGRARRPPSPSCGARRSRRRRPGRAAGPSGGTASWTSATCAPIASARCAHARAPRVRRAAAAGASG